MRLNHERRVQAYALLAGLPAVALSLYLLATGGYSPRLQWTLGGLLVLAWMGFASAVRERVASPLRTLASLLEAMREGDYSYRARGCPR